MKKSGHADLPLHYGHVPVWLAARMKKLGGAIVEAIVLDYGNAEVLSRLSDPSGSKRSDVCLEWTGILQESLLL